MRALTVQQPWAWSILFGGKDVENRTWRTSYVGSLGIHAGVRLSEDGCMRVPDLLADDLLAAYADTELVYGALLGFVDLLGVHRAGEGCCASPWGEHAAAGGRAVYHWQLADPRPLDWPVPCRGALQVWKVPAEVAGLLAS